MALLREFRCQDNAPTVTMVDSTGTNNWNLNSLGNSEDISVLQGPGGLYPRAFDNPGGFQDHALSPGNESGLPAYDQPRAYSWWLKKSSGDSSRDIWQYGSNIQRVTNTGAQLNLFTGGSAGNFTASGFPNIYDNQWHHVAAHHTAYGSGGLKAWVDGTEYPAGSIFNTPGSMNGQCYFMNSTFGLYAGFEIHSGGFDQALVDSIIAKAYPQNTVPPTIDGTGEVGSDLTVTSTGSWSDGSTTGYQWQTDQGISNWVNITNETTDTYNVQAGDEGNMLRCLITRSNSVGSTDAPSNAIEAIAGGPGTVDAAAALVSALTISATPSVQTFIDAATSLASTLAISATPNVLLSSGAASLSSTLTISATPSVLAPDYVDVATGLASTVVISATPTVGDPDKVEGATALSSTLTISATPSVQAPDYVSASTALASSVAISATPMIQEPGQVDAAAALDGALTISATPTVDAADTVNAAAALASAVVISATPEVQAADYVDAAVSLDSVAAISASGQVYDVDVTAAAALTSALTISAIPRVVTPDLGPLYQAASLPAPVRDATLLCSPVREALTSEASRDGAAAGFDREAVIL